MKKFIAIMLSLCVIISIFGCYFLGFGTLHETSVEKYGEWEDLETPSFLPKDVSIFTVNSYSFTLYNYMDTCYEIFLDVTVDENEFNSLIDTAKSYSNSYKEQPADYCDGYTEIVFTDNYERGDINSHDNKEQVGFADIEKVIYNPDTNNIVYEVLHADDTNVYDVENIAYFNRFSITAEEYE